MHRLYRSREDRIILGVCGGFAKYLELDPAFVRIITVVLWVFSGVVPLLIAYLVAGLIIPLEPRSAAPSEYRHLFRSKTDRKIAGICGGLGKLTQVDATIIRLAAVFLCIQTGILPQLLVYLIGWMINPEKYPSNPA